MYRTINTSLYDPQSVLAYANIADGCWKWMGAMYQNGYGKYNRVMAHRLVYELLVDKVPTDKCLDHLCRERDCVNPDHLEVVTLVENVMRGESQHAINARKTHCKRGHEFTPENTYYHPKRGRRHCRTCPKMAGKN